MKQLITFLFCLFTLFAEAQVNTNDTNKYFKSYDYGFSYRRLQAREAFIMPTDTVINKLGAVSLNGVIYLGNGIKWTSIGGGTTIDTTNQFVKRLTRTPGKDSIIYFVGANRFAIKDSIGTSTDTTSLSNRINKKIDSLKRSSDSVYAFINGVKTFQFKDSVGGGTTPTLQQVTNAGNTTTNTISVNSLNIGATGTKINLSGYTNNLTIYNEGTSDEILNITNSATGSLKFGGGAYNYVEISNNPAGNVNLSAPSTGGTIPVSVNGNFANSAGNITISTGSGNGRFGNDTATVVMVKVHNESGVQLTNGKVVAFSHSGTQSNEPAVRLANNRHDSTSANTLGFVSGTINVNDTGWVILSGKIEKLNTSAFSNGDIIYLDSINGNYTKSKPFGPFHMVYLGVVIKANAGNGSIFVKAQNGYEMSEIHDAQIINTINNQIIVYSDTQKVWKNRSIYSVVDTSSTIATKLNVALKLNISDTASMLSNYSTRINGKLNISDANQSLTAYQYLGSTIKAFPIGVTGFANGTVSYAHVSPRMLLVAMYIPQTTTVTGVKYVVTSAGTLFVGNANYNGFVLYDYNKSTGLCTRIDSTANDNTIWTTTGTQQKAFVTPMSLSQGVYYLGVMCQGTATTMPGILQNAALLGLSTFDLTSPARITAQIVGATIPASFNLSTSTLNTNLPILMLY